MHGPAGVVEILVQILQFSPYSEVQNTPPQNENCHRVQIREFQNTPPQNENCQRVQVREFQNTPQNENLSESPSLRVSEYPSNENCHRVQIREFQNTPLPPKSEKLQISNVKIV